jgi:molecular chaperone GrpE
MSSEDLSARASSNDAASPEARQERDDLYDRLLRLTAEFDNYRKRTERERRDLGEAAGADVIRELLPIVDDLERALGAPIERGPGAEQVAKFREGIELIRRQLIELLRRRGVEAFDAVGRDFDPEWHEAVASEPAEGRRDGEVTAEIRRGYRIGSRLLRPAMVKVAKA